MSIFNDLAKTFKQKTQKTGSGLFDAISNYFAPVADKTRIRDIVREVPNASGAGALEATAKFGKALGQGVVDAGAKIAVSAGEIMPRAVFKDKAGAITDPVKLPGFLGEVVSPVTSYQTDVSKRVSEGQSQTEALFKTSGQVALDEPIGFAFKPLFLAGSLLLKAGGKDLIEKSVDVIAKTKSVEEITSVKEVVTDCATANVWVFTSK